jgi:hypothetical protein
MRRQLNSSETNQLIDYAVELIQKDLEWFSCLALNKAWGALGFSSNSKLSRTVFRIGYASKFCRARWWDIGKGRILSYETVQEYKNERIAALLSMKESE